MSRRPNPLRTVSCVICGNEFQTSHSQAKYCSPICSREGERASWRAYAGRNRGARRKYHHELYQANRDGQIARTKRYHKTDAGKAATRNNDERQRQKFPEKYAARQAVLVAVRKGILVKQPCKQCGASKAQAHHPDYSKPLDVVWLCDPCHRAEHGRALRQPDLLAAE